MSNNTNISSRVNNTNDLIGKLGVNYPDNISSILTTNNYINYNIHELPVNSNRRVNELPSSISNQVYELPANNSNQNLHSNSNLSEFNSLRVEIVSFYKQLYRYNADDYPINYIGIN